MDNSKKNHLTETKEVKSPKPFDPDDLTKRPFKVTGSVAETAADIMNQEAKKASQD